MGLTWTHIVFTIASLAMLPLYIFILFVICLQIKLSTFYVLLISQGIADIFAVINFFFASTLRYTSLFDEFYWNNQKILANYSFLSFYFTICVRSAGTALISVQRYFTICLSGKPCGKTFCLIPSSVYVIVHWTSAVLLTVPLCKSLHSSFTAPYKLSMVNPPQQLADASLMAVTTVATCFTVSMVSYALILVHLLSLRSLRKRSDRYEIRLCVQAMGLLLALLLFFVYYVAMYVIGYIIGNNVSLLTKWRLYAPLITGFGTWVQPWMLLAFNREIRQNIIKTVLCRKEPLCETTTMRTVSVWDVERHRVHVV
uniref:G_PROTEIN_RECEP_F1_2 domain-containing protein n=1 Tax=Haemonchus contortus TaxID=6289 RepID=A0A7I4YNM3_HAECO